MRKKIILAVIFLTNMLPMLFVDAQAPSFDDFTAGLAEGEERVYVIDSISADQTLQDNIVNLFYPDVTGNRAILWQYIRVIGVGIFVLFLIYNALQLLFKGNDEAKVKESLQNIGVMFLGAVFYFGAVWILGIGLNLNAGGTATELIKSLENNVVFQILAFLKAAAFFAAIIALILAAFKIMGAMDQEDKIKAGRQGFINIILALVFIKIIDFVYLIAQRDSFLTETTSLIISAAQIIGWIVGIAFIIALIYGGYLFITDSGDGEGAKKGGKMILNVFIVGLVIFLFLLIVYQMINQFV